MAKSESSNTPASKPKKAAATKAEILTTDRKAEKLALLRQKLKNSYVSGDEFTPKEWLPVGHPDLQAILSKGKGIPRGIIVEICGYSQSGKTHLCYLTIAEAQREGHMCAFVNAENGFYDERAMELGVQVNDSNLFGMIDGCETAEEYASQIETLVTSELFSYVVVDSISSLVPQEDYEKGYDENSSMGLHARFVKKFTNKLNQLCRKHNTTVIFINQFKAAAAGKMPGKFEDKPTGGKSLEHNARIRIWMERVGGEKGKMLGKGGKRIGGYTKCLIMKGNYGGQDEEVVIGIKYVQADSDPIGEFMAKVKSQGSYDLKNIYYVKKKAKTKDRPACQLHCYADPDTGVVEVQEEDTIAFIRGLMNTEAPEKFRKAGKGDSAFEFCGSKIKLYDSQKKVLIEALDNPHGDIVPPEEVDASDVLSGGLNLDDELVGEDLTDDED